MLCEKILCQMVEENIYEHPEPYLNLKLVLSISVNTYNVLKREGCPESRLQLVRQWIEEIGTMLTGQDPTVALLQQTFASQDPAAQAAPVAPQAGMNPQNPGQ
jgi:hypothetical protein